MTSIAQRRLRPAEHPEAELAQGLRARRAEIEGAVLNRVHSVSDATEVSEPEYLDGLRSAVSAAIAYGLEAIERGEERAPPMPVPLLAQARLAARSGVGLDTVLRRYFAGHALLGDFILEEAERRGSLSGEALQRLLRSQAALFDALLASVSQEYARETGAVVRGSEERRAERVRRLLDGELIDAAELDYDLKAHHLGLVAKGASVEALRDLATTLDRRLLIARQGEGTVWAWLGGRHRSNPDELCCRLASQWPADAVVAIGEPGVGLSGWRITHRQARAALTVALRKGQAVARYADFAVLASMLGDDLLVDSLNALYIAPLEKDRDDDVLRQTLHAYFSVACNTSAAAATLGVTRQTVTNRLRTAEERVGRPIIDCTFELTAALRLAELDKPG